jgi:hypothetical protein
MECHSLQSLSSVKQRAHGNMSVVMRRETSRAPELAISSPRRKNGWFLVLVVACKKYFVCFVLVFGGTAE